MSVTPMIPLEIIFWALIILAITLSIMVIALDRKKNVISKIDSVEYEVRDIPGSGESANRLALINREVNRLVKYMKSNDLPSKNTAARLYEKWGQCKLKETLEHDSSVAFTFNKGQEIHLCLRNKENGLEDFNTGMFVVLHELAHVMSTSYGHNDEFYTNFDSILAIASKIGVYRPLDFSNVNTYCGSIIPKDKVPDLTFFQTVRSRIGSWI